MDLGCADLGFLSETKQTHTASPESAYKEHGSGGSMSATMKDGKNKALKQTGQITVNALNKFTTQIKKPPHRKNSPVNWFPRKKVDSYLKRKIKMLQDLGGMNTSLDETLGEANPHYTRVEKEKMAAREAAHNAMEARKAAMIEASWCRILQAARIQSKEAEALLLKAEKIVAEAFEAAAAMGVIMYDIPNCPKRPCDIEAPSNHGGESTAAHTVAASFETAFEVDKEVAAAVKVAFIKLANCSSISKDEFKDLLQKISQKPELSDGDLSDFSSECESESEAASVGLQESEIIRQRKCRKTGDFDNCNKRKLVGMMLERLKCLQEEELASLATIVATRGLSAALEEVEHAKQHDQGSLAVVNSGIHHKLIHRMSSLGGKPIKLSEMELESQMRNKQVDSQLPSLDKFLVKHVSKLEKEVLEAKKTRMNESIKGAPTANGENSDNFNDVVNPVKAVILSESVPDLGSILVKHSSKLEKAVHKAKAGQNSGRYCQTERRNSSVGAAIFDPVPDLGSILLPPKHSSKFEKDIGASKRKWGNSLELSSKNSGKIRNGRKLEAHEAAPSLDKCLVKHISKLEREVLEAKRMENNSIRGGPGAKENIDTKYYNVAAKTEKAGTNNMAVKSLDEILVKPREKVLVKHISRLDREKLRCSNKEFAAAPLKRSDRRRLLEVEVNNNNEGGLDQILVKHKSRLEGEKVRWRRTIEEEVVKKKVNKSDRSVQVGTNEGGLDQILVKHESGLEREKKIAAAAAAAAQQPGVQINYSAARREARERELQAAWGGLSLGNSVRPYLSKLEREKAAWVKAEEEQRRLEV